MYTKKFSIPLQYPVYQCRLNLLSSKVKRPSGIARIVLELIKSYNSANTLFSDEMIRFGVPYELHYIFANELVDLCSWGIIKCRYGDFSAEHFTSCYISDFTFTELGIKVYQEGYLITNDQRVSQLDVRYDSVSENISVNDSGKLLVPADTFFKSANLPELTDELFDYEELFDRNRSKIGIRKEERFLNGELLDAVPLIKQKKNGLQIALSGNSIKVYSKDEAETEYFNKNLGSNYLYSMLTDNLIYRFDMELPQTDSLPDYGEVSCCFLKDDLSSFLRFAPLLILDKSLLKLSVGKCPLIIRDESLTSVLDTIDNNITMAILGKEGFSLYLPVKMHYVLDNTDNKVPVDTLFEIKCDNDTTLSILNKLCARVCISGYTTENAKIIVCIAKYTDNLSILSDYLENTVSKLHDTSVIADFNSLCKGIDGWKERFVAFVQRYISECSQSINVANIRHSHSELLPLKKAADISDAEYIRILTSGVNVDNNTEMLYQAFEQLGYKTELIMPVINIVRYYLTQILESKLEIHIRNRISDTFVSLYQSLEALKTVSGVSSYLTYDVKDSFDKTDFIENYKTFVKKAEDIRKYRIFDEESFIALDGYIQIFDSIRDVIIMEKAVLEAPDSITRNYILEKIRSSDFKNAISDMYVRLQYELQNYYSMEDETIFNLLSYIEDDKLAEEKTISILHELRVCRNNYYHPSRKKELPTTAVIKEWCDVLFEFIGGLHEQDGED